MKTIDNVEFYEDSYFEKKFNKTYTIEVSGDRARVINPLNGVFGGREKSRLNKIGAVGRIDKVRLYSLTVEGKVRFFKTTESLL